MSTGVNPIVSGLLNGYALAQRIRQAALEQQVMERQKAAAEQESQMRDLQTRMMLNQNGRPVSPAGTVEEDTITPPNIGGIPEDTLNAGAFKPVRKAEPGRTVRYKSPSGEIITTELYSPEEQAAKAMQSRLAESKALGSVDVWKEAEKAKALRELNQYHVPGYGDVSKEVIPFLIAKEAQKAAEDRAAADRTSRENIAKLSRDAAEQRAKLRANATVQSAKIRASIPKGATGAEAAAEKGRVQAEKQMHQLEKQEGDLHAYRNTLFAQIQAADESPDEAQFVPEGWKPGRALRPLATDQKMREAQVKAMQRRYQEVTDQTARIMVEKYDRMQKAGGEPDVPLEQALRDIGVDPKKYMGGAASSTPSTPPQKQGVPLPAPGQIVTQGGKRYRVLGHNADGTVNAQPLD